MQGGFLEWVKKNEENPEILRRDCTGRQLCLKNKSRTNQESGMKEGIYTLFYIVVSWMNTIAVVARCHVINYQNPLSSINTLCVLPEQLESCISHLLAPAIII